VADDDVLKPMEMSGMKEVDRTDKRMRVKLMAGNSNIQANG
jgi:hypothetical protein